MGRKLHDAPGDAGALGQGWRQFAINLEPQHIARGRFEQLAGTVERDHTAGLEHGDAAAQGFSLFEVMGGQQHGVALLVEPCNELPQVLAQLHIHTGSGLIEHDHRRLVHQRLGHQHAALHAPRELAHVGVGLVGQAQAVEQLVNPCIVVADAEVARLKAQRLAHIEKRVEHQLLRHHAEFAPGLRIVDLDIAAQHLDPPGSGAGQAGEYGDQGGLARTIGA